MSESYQVILPGCTPEPLMSYLKALGILRLISEQADPEATACWRNDQYVLRSRLDSMSLSQFFLNKYQPTPITGPWAGGSGFFGNDNRNAVDAIAASESARAVPYQRIIAQVRLILDDEGLAEKPSEQNKTHLLRRYRREMPDEFVQWMDAAMVLQSEGQAFAPVLGTGGNDGRLDFTQNFMQRLVELKLFDAKPAPRSESLLNQALFAEPTPGMGKAAVGQFSPGRAGGPNATQGMEGSSTDNPWDFVFMLEGALMLAGSVARRLGTTSIDKAVFPFTVRARPVGQASSTEDESSEARGELWLPVWDQCVGLRELRTLFAEGRAELSGKPARDTIAFARSVAGLGLDRGVRSFVRYGFLKRSGKAFLATAMNRFRVPDRPCEATDLLDRLDFWLDAFRRGCGSRESPARFKPALRQIESAIFAYCRYGRREDMQAVLVALGHAERELALTGGQRSGKAICPTLQNLSSQWLKATHDETPEYAFALALAGIHDRENKIGALRGNLEPVGVERNRWIWKPSGPRVVWTNADLSTNMASVLERRVMDGVRAGCEHLPLDFKRTLSLDMIALFIAGGLDDRRIEHLLWGLMLIDHRQQYPSGIPRVRIDHAPPLPREYALLKLLFLPRPLLRRWDEEHQRWNWRLAHPSSTANRKEDLENGLTIRTDPRVLPLLRAGRLEEACRIAHQRLRASGLTPLPGPTSSGFSRRSDWEHDPSLKPKRLAASLLLPVGNDVVNQLVHLVTRQDSQHETVSETFMTEGASQS